VDGSFIQPYDILMLVILALTTLFGAWKGMAWQLASVASFVLSFLVASRCSGVLAPYLSSHAPWNRVLAMLILFVATSAAVWIVFRLVAGLIDKVRLKEFDRQLGALLGVVKGALLCLVITFFAVTLSETLRQKVLVSRSGYYIAKLIDQAGPVLPEEVQGVLGRYIEELDRKLDPSTPPDTPRTAETDSRNVAAPSAENERPLSGELGIDTLQDRLDEARQGIEGVRRSLDSLGRDAGALGDDLNRAGQNVRRGLDAVGDRVGDVRSGGDAPEEPRR
jgi:membrane protein required for colicin V production